VRAPFVISAPVASGSTVGVDGAIVANGDYQVGIPVGVLSGNETVTVTPLSRSDMPLALPDGFDLAGH